MRNSESIIPQPLSEDGIALNTARIRVIARKRREIACKEGFQELRLVPQGVAARAFSESGREEGREGTSIYDAHFRDRGCFETGLVYNDTHRS